MPQAGGETPKLHPFWQILSDLFAVIRLLRGPILASIAAAVVFYLPDQIRELYRIDAADRDWSDIATSVLALTAMCIAFWWVSFRIVESLGQLQYPTTWPARVLMALLPGLIGALPLAACGGGLLAAKTLRSLQSDLTSPWAGKAEEISTQTLSGLDAGAAALFAMAAILLAASLLGAWRHRRAIAGAPGTSSGFFSVYGFLVSVAIVAGATAAVVAFPVAVPTALGTLPLVALFFVAIILMVGQMTFWHQWTGTPFLILLAVGALAFSAFDLNDNHEIARVTDPAKAAPAEAHTAMLQDSWGSFQAWYKARPNKDQFKTIYPVYIVAAQGGGIYAAYHAATLLARLQDRCPEFRNHLFAISSVSGGSLGAAVFASTVKALAAGGPDPAPAAATAPGDAAAASQPFLPCPSMEHAGSSRVISQVPGPHEQASAKILASDFLSPLVAGTLFPDFTQAFLPYPVPQLDRARWIERAFERSWAAAGLVGPNPFEESMLKAWSPTGPGPALLINLTETDSGRRVVVSPFTIGNGWEVLRFPLEDRWVSNPRRRCRGHEISLSTAVGLSARFPWMTPAGSLTSECGNLGVPIKTRIVDGGYFDNSGVETALDVIDRIESTLRQTNGRVEGTDGPRVALHLIVLTTGEFPRRSGYGLGDVLEPIRGLLSTQEARIPITIERAAQQLKLPAPGSDTTNPSWADLVDRLHKARFRNPIYQMPLGWRISRASRNIIDIQNGRFWDCDPDHNFRQKEEGDFADADCIQMLVYHQLNETLEDELKVLSAAEDWRRRRPQERTPPQRLDHNRFMACYNDALRAAARSAGAKAKQEDAGAAAARSGLQRRQRDAIEQVLLLWDRNPQFTDDRWLAYMLAVLDFESGGVPSRDGGCLTDKCALRYLERMSRSAGATYKKLLTPEANGNHYYGRGFLQLSTAETYRRVAEITGEPIYDQPDLLLAPDVSARVLFAWMTDSRLSPNRTVDSFTTAAGFDLDRALGVHLGGLRFRETPLLVRVRERVKEANARFAACIASAKTAN